jgi:hypothetical protein
MWKVPGGIYTMPGGLVILYLLAADTPCNWPSLGAPEDFPTLPHPVAIKATSAVKADRFFIFIILKGIGQK